MKSKYISINTALKFAVDKHKLTFREGEVKDVKIPYIIHPMQVMILLVEWQIVDETALRAALCHDILEDTKTSPKEMIAKIGKTATSIVEELTYDVSIHKSKKNYLKTFYKSSIEALVIKLADRICNVRSFMALSDEYSVIYMKKAEELFKAYELRQSEIDETFGEDTCRKFITPTIDYLKYELEKLGSFFVKKELKL